MAKKPEKAKPEKGNEKPDEAAEAKKGGGGLVGLIMLGAASLASSFGLFYFLSPAPMDAAAACPAAETEEAAKVAPLAQANYSYVQIKEVLITVGSAPATRYLKMNVSVITDSSGVSTVKNAEPMLIDAFNTYLRTIELEDFENPAFYSHLREQLARRSELVLGNSVSKGVLITEFLLR